MNVFVADARKSYEVAKENVDSLMEMIEDQFDIVELQDTESYRADKDEVLKRIRKRLANFSLVVHDKAQEKGPTS